jgi:hypothetical protein
MTSITTWILVCLVRRRKASRTEVCFFLRQSPKRCGEPCALAIDVVIERADTQAVSLGDNQPRNPVELLNGG